MGDKEVQVATANNKFTIDMYKALSKTPGNVFFSPLSAHAALSMCYQGASGTTSEHFSAALHVPDKTLVAEGYASIMQSLNSVAEVALHIANKVYVMSGYRFRKEFQSVVVEKFKSAVETTNFGDSKAAATAINNWVKEKTQEKIQRLFEDDAFDSDTRTVLVNAVYFKGNWKEKFNKEQTKTEPFFIDEKTTIDCQMMFNKGKYRMESDDTLKANVLELPYTNTNVSMFIILPNDKYGIAEVEAKLSDVDLDSVFKKVKGSYEHTVCLALPKFKIEVFMDLEDSLKQLGLGELFIQGKCNLSEMLESCADLYVSQAIQKAFIEVNEEGAEAAAVTAIHTKARSLVKIRSTDFIVDHPFLFCIVVTGDDCYHNLFYGKIVQPPQ